VKKLFAVLAVFALAAVGCDDKKSSNKPTNATTGGTYVSTVTHKDTVINKVTDTVVEKHVNETHVGTVVNTTTVKETVKPADPKLPTPPAGGGDKGKDGGK
jgi:hypothetical protein